MDEKFSAVLLLIGVVLLITGAAVVFSAMNQAIESPFITDVSSTWNVEFLGLTALMIGIILTPIGFLKFFRYF